MKKSVQASTLASAVVIGLLAGCASNDPAQESASEASTVADVKLFSGLLGGYMADYTPYKTLDELANASDVVATGRVVAVHPGRTLYTGDPDESQTVIFEVAVDELYKGEALDESNTIYLEMRSGGRTTEDFDEAVPRDLEVALYLVEAPLSGGDYGKVVASDGVASDFESSLLKPINPQGFVMEGPEGGTLEPMEGEWSKNAEIADFIPPS